MEERLFENGWTLTNKRYIIFFLERAKILINFEIQ